MVDALASRAEEGRSQAAISYGKPLAGVTVDLRMGQPSWFYHQELRKQRQVAELKHLSRPRKRDYSLSSGERTGKSPNLYSFGSVGVMDHHKRVSNRRLVERFWKDLSKKVKTP
jgi:hypothetical protein